MKYRPIICEAQTEDFATGAPHGSRFAGASMDYIQLNRSSCIRLALNGSDEIQIAFGEGSSRQELSCAEPLLFAWLLSLRNPTTENEALRLAQKLLGVSEDGARSVLCRLKEEGLIEAVSQEKQQTQSAVARWVRWGWRDALDFHLATRNLVFESGDDLGFARQLEALKDWVDDARTGSDEASPGPYKQFRDAARFALPSSRRGIDAVPFGQALYARRTCRAFDCRQIPFAAFSEMLEHAFGKTGEIDFGSTGIHLIRTSPSGGARHPVEIYPVIINVEGLEPGVYHYSVQDHALEFLRPGLFAEEVWDVSHRQRGMKNVSVAIFYTARWARHIWKYRYARSYRMVLFDVAHLAQTQLLTAAALGLRTFLTPAVKDTEAGQLLMCGDYLDESVVYLTGLG